MSHMSERDLNILMIIDRYLPIWGGAENQLHQLIPFLQKKGCHVKVVTRRWSRELAKTETLDGVSIFRVGIPGHSHIASVCYIIGLLTYCLKNFREIDVIHTHGAAALGAVGSILGAVFRKPNIAKIATGRRIPLLADGVFGRLILYFFKRSTYVVCMNEGIHHELESIRIEETKLRFAKNSVDSDRFRRASWNKRSLFRKERKWEAEDIVVVFSGRIVARKGLDVLIEAWREIAPKWPSCHLLILGSGNNQLESQEDDMRELAKGLSNVHFEGEIVRVEEYLGIADIYVSPSRTEGISNALLEAMASELCCIATDIDGNRELIFPNRTGMLVPVDNAEKVAETITLLLKNKEKMSLLGKEARSFTIANHSFDALASFYRDTYKDMLFPL